MRIFGSFCANSSARPPGRASASASATAAEMGVATSTASAPRLPGRARTTLADPRHRADISSEAAAVGVEPSREAHFLVRRALREQFPLAIEAAAAGNVMKTDHAVAELPPLYAAACRNHGARNFMPEDLRGWHKAVLDFLDIGTADAAGGNPNQDLAIGNCWDGDLFHHDAPGATVHSRAHLLQCRSCRKWRFELGGYGAHVHEISSATSE